MLPFIIFLVLLACVALQFGLFRLAFWLEDRGHPRLAFVPLAGMIVVLLGIVAISSL